MRRLLYLAATLVTLVFAAGCGEDPYPIDVEPNAITLTNQTSDDWKDVLIVVNDHYRGGVPVLKPDGRLNAPISQFETGYGQRWPAGTRITKVVVTATSAKGEAVNLTWDINNPPKKRR